MRVRISTCHRVTSLLLPWRWPRAAATRHGDRASGRGTNRTPADTFPGIEPLEPRVLLAATKIAIIGSSSAEGVVGSNSFRRPLWRSLRDAGHDVNFVGSKNTNQNGSTPPNNDFDRDNDGRSGWHAHHFLTGRDGVPKLANLLKGSSSDGEAYTPDIAIIYLGHNDLFNNESPASTANEISQLIDVLRADNPNVTIILGQLHSSMWGQAGYKNIPNGNVNASIADYNSRLADLAQQKNTAASRVVTVDVNSGFNPARASDGGLTTDGQHATGQGEQFIANRFYSRIQNFLPAPDNNRILIQYAGDLVTTESGNQASFTVRLAFKPQFNVTLALASSDTSEGTINRSTITFTPGNWNQPQTITITGRDDGNLDGLIHYTINVTAADSTDPAFDNLAAASLPKIPVVNVDNEHPPDGVGDRPATAKRISSRKSPQLLQERVGNGDAADVYRLRVKSLSRMRLRLKGTFGDARIQLLDASGRRIRSAAVRTRDRAIDASLLDRGTYFIRVVSRDNIDTPYRLRLVRKPV